MQIWGTILSAPKIDSINLVKNIPTEKSYFSSKSRKFYRLQITAYDYDHDYSKWMIRWTKQTPWVTGWNIDKLSLENWSL